MAERTSGAIAGITPPKAAPARDRGADATHGDGVAGYALDEQVGFVLRRVHQRHSSIFQEHMADLTPMQWAALVKLREADALSQNHLGRLTAMDAATMQGVVRRLMARDLLSRRADPVDRRRLLLCLTAKGIAVVDSMLPGAFAITRETLSPLAPKERDVLLRLLRRLC